MSRIGRLLSVLFVACCAAWIVATPFVASAVDPAFAGDGDAVRGAPGVVASLGGTGEGIAFAGDAVLFGAGRHLYAARTTPDGFRLVGTASLPGPARGIAVAGTLAAVGHDRGLTVVDVTRAERPRALGNLVLPPAGDKPAWGYFRPRVWAMTADRVFVTTMETSPMPGWTVYAIDISDPTAPQIAASTRRGGVGSQTSLAGVAVAGDIVLVLWREHGIAVCRGAVQANRSDNLASIGQVSTTSCPVGLVAMPGRAFVDVRAQPESDQSAYDQVQLYDVDAGGHLNLVATHDTPGRLEAADGSVAYFVDKARTLHPVDYADPRSPAPGAPVALPNEACEEWIVAGGRMARACAAPGVRTVRASDLADSPTPSTTRSVSVTDWSARDAAVSARAAFVTRSQDNRLGVLALDGRGAPAWPPRWVDGRFGHLTVSGDRLASWGACSIDLYDVPQGADPLKVGQYAIEECTVKDVAAIDDVLLVAQDARGVVVVDVSDPAAPWETAVVPMAAASRIRLVGGDVFVLTATGVVLLDVTVPAAPRVLGEYRASTNGLAVRDRVVAATVADQWGTYDRLDVVDFADPAFPRLLGSWTPPRYEGRLPAKALDVAIRGSEVFVATDYCEVVVYDVTDPTAITSTARILPGGFPERLVPSGDSVLVAAQEGGLVVLGRPADPSVWIGHAWLPDVRR